MNNPSDLTAIDIKELTKIYGHKKAVNGLTTTVAKGDIYGLVGPNGAGKTTTIRMLAGLVFPSGGDALIMGHSIRTDIRQTSLKTGFMMETPAFYPHLSGFDNLLVYFHSLGGSKDSRIKEVLQEVGLSKDARVAYKNYSLGMKKRLDLARLLIKDPDIFILDEPTNGLDPFGVQWIHELLLDMANSGKTILFSSHLLHDVEKLCTKVAFINNGHIIHEERINRNMNELVSVKLRFPNKAILENALPDIDHQITRYVNDDSLIMDVSRSSLEHVLQSLAKRNIYPTEVVAQDRLEKLFFKLMGKEENQQ